MTLDASDCIFGFGKHEPDCSFLKPENPAEFTFTVIRLGYTCSKCENKINKIYDKQITPFTSSMSDNI